MEDCLIVIRNWNPQSSSW